MADPTHLPLDFPLSGVDRGSEYELQPAGTTPTGVNVRGLDPATLRERGASRPGTVRFIDAQPAGVSSMIQELTVVVTADGEAMLGAFESTGGVSGVPPGTVYDAGGGPDGIADPSTNNEAGGDTDPDNPLTRNPDRVIPDGGSGVTPNRHEPGDGESSGWEFVQKNKEFFPFSSGGTRTDQLAFDTPTEDNQMLVVVYWTAGDDDGAVDYQPTFAVTDSLGNTYAEAEVVSYNSTPGSGAEVLGVWWTRNTVAGACTVSVQQTNTRPGGTFVGGGALLILEYRGLQTSTPADGAVSSGFTIENDGTNQTGTLTTGAVPIGGSTRLVLGAFTFSHVTLSAVLTTPDGYTLRQDHNEDDFGLALYEKLSSSSSEAVAVPYDNSALPFNGADIAIVGAGWRYR